MINTCMDCTTGFVTHVGTGDLSVTEISKVRWSGSATLSERGSTPATNASS